MKRLVPPEQESGAPVVVSRYTHWRFSRATGKVSEHKAMKFSLLCLAGLLTAVAPLAAAPVDYVREVKPIFTEHCYRCHGASQHKSELRMDTVTFALKGGDNGSALKPGNNADSLMVKLLKGTHPDLARMPYKKPPLSAAQIALVEQWIEQGAKAPADEAPESAKHWAFAPPVHVPPPAVKQTGWPRNPVDNFILARLETDAIKPSPEADRATLVRRLSLDLTGLPPTVAQVEEFARDQRSDAYNRAVERLLASPHFGE